MNPNYQQIAGAFLVNKEIIGIFTDEQVGQKRQQIFKWIRDLIDKPKHAIKEEERLRAVDNDTQLISEILSGDIEFRMSYFNRITEDLIAEFKAAPVKEGNLYVRSFTFKIWKLKKARIDEARRCLCLISKKKTKKEKAFSLATYTVNWAGPKKEYQAFSFDSTSSSNKRKQIMFGWLNTEGSRLWMDSILRCQSEITIQNNELGRSFEQPQLQQQQSYSTLNSSTSADQKSNHSTNKLDSRTPEDSYEVEKAGKPKNATQISPLNSKSPQLSPTIKIAANNIKLDEDTSETSKQEETKHQHEPIQSSPAHPSKTKIEVNQTSTFSSSSQQLQKPSPVTKTTTSAHEIPSNPPKQQDIKVTKSPRLNGSGAILSDEQAAVNKANMMLSAISVESSTVKKSPVRATGVLASPSISVTEPREIITTQLSLSSTNQAMYQPETSLFRSLDVAEERKIPPAVQQFLTDYQLSSLPEEKNYKTLSFNNGMRFLQHNEDPRMFKIFLALQGVTAFDVFNCICRTDDYNKWNNNVSETKILNIMKNEQSVIVYQKHKGIGIMYRPRDYVYLRHAFLQQDTYYIIDRSIQYESLPSGLSTVRGEIEYVVWSFQQHPTDETRSLMIGDFFYNNSGYSNKEQDASITYSYLQNFQNLSGYLHQKSFSNKQSINVFNIPDNGLMKKVLNSMTEQRKNQQLSFLQEGQELLTSQEMPQQVGFSKNNSHQEESSELPQDAGDDDRVSSGSGDGNTSISVTEDDEAAVRAANYREEELLNSQLNHDLNNFSKDILISEEQDGGANRTSSSGVELQKRREEDKLAKMTIQQIIEMVDKNQHWGLCVDQYFSPTTIPHKENRLASDPVNGHYQFKNDWERDPKTGKFIFLNKDKIQAQKKVISFILSKIGSNIISGKSITSISLPIDIFETRSNLERFAYSSSFAPIYLRKAGELTNPVEQMKNAGIFLITTTIMYLNLEKPFNPILGETFQGRLDGDPFYVEQISHHPPICAYQYYTDSYMLSAQLESIANIHANSVTGINQGNIRVDFKKTKNWIGMIQAPGSLNGTAIGTRYMSVDGKYIAYDLKNKLVFEVKVNPEKKGLFKSATTPIDYFAGGIYRVTDKFVNKFNSLKPNFYKFQGLNMKEDVVEQVSVITGIWNKEIFIDDQKVFDIEEPAPYALEYEANPLASDCNYRQDILALRDGNKKQGQEYKEKLEVFQRADRKLREKAAEVRKKLLKKMKK